MVAGVVKSLGQNKKLGELSESTATSMGEEMRCPKREPVSEANMQSVSKSIYSWSGIKRGAWWNKEILAEIRRTRLVVVSSP
jgi:hypothetical protein